MKIAPIRNSVSQSGKLNFQGVTTDYQIRKGKDDLKNNSYWHKNSSVEEAVGAYHKNLTGKVYFANPMEPVGDVIKDKVDYVVYDNEPKYPVLEDVRENYLGKSRKNLRDDFNEVREYYYRREMGGYADAVEAKYKQWEAAELTGFYDRAGDARYRKESLEDGIAVIDNSIKQKENEIGVLKGIAADNQARKNDLEIKLDNYLKKNKRYTEIEQLSLEVADKNTEEANFVAKQIENIKKEIERCKAAISDCVENIRKATASIYTKRGEINQLSAERIVKNQNLKDVIEKELKPMFNAFKNFCRQHRVKGI